MSWFMLLAAIALCFIVVRPLRLIAARDPVLTVCLLLCAALGAFVGAWMSVHAPPQHRGAWWWQPANTLAAAFMLGPQTARWIRSLGRKP